MLSILCLAVYLKTGKDLGLAWYKALATDLVIAYLIVEAFVS